MVSPLIDTCLGTVPTNNGQLYGPVTKYPSFSMAFIFLLMNVKHDSLL